MIYINNGNKNIYNKRPGAYAIIENDKNEIAIVKDGDNDLFYFGGGLEEGENTIEALNRELIEESGYTLTNISYFTEIGEFLKSKNGEYVEVMATIYTAKFDKKVVEPIEKDHHIMWINPCEYKGKLFRNWQNYVLDIYINYIKSYDGFITKEILDGKTIFWDIDGTLAPYRFNNHVTASDDFNNGVSIKEIEENIFLKRKPSRFMQNIIKNTNIAKNIVMGYCINDKEISDKQKWLDIYFPMIEDRILVDENFSKVDCIIEYCNKNNINLTEVIFVDDIIKYLREAESKGIEAWHISSFIDFYYSKRK